MQQPQRLGVLMRAERRRPSRIEYSDGESSWLLLLEPCSTQHAHQHLAAGHPDKRSDSIMPAGLLDHIS